MFLIICYHFIILIHKPIIVTDIWNLRLYSHESHPSKILDLYWGK